MEINRPDVLAEVQAAYRRYEDALLAADTKTLDELFWADPLVIRFGADNIQYGYRAVSALNARRVPNPDRRLTDTVVTTFGSDFATATTLYTDVPDGQVGRQMQSWARTPDGWRVVAAHVSVIDKAPIER